MKVSVKRNSKIELLRVISMLFIIMSHYSVHGNTDISNLKFGFTRIFLEITVLGNLGVNLFILITGYYSKSENYYLEKILKFIFQVSFYSISIYIILILFGKIKFNYIEMIKVFFPITFNQYWFATAYFVLLILSPFINKFFNRINKKEHFKFILILFTLFSAFRTLTAQDFYGNQLTHFIMIYSIGAYISRYKTKFNMKANVISISTISILLLIITIIVDRLCNYYNLNLSYVKYFLSRQSIFIVLLSINILILFLHRPFENKIINYFSPSIFGIYLIHDNLFLRKILWEDILKTSMYSNTNYFFVHWIVSILLIFVICLLIDTIRRKFIEEKMLHNCKKVANFFENKSKIIISKIFYLVN